MSRKLHHYAVMGKYPVRVHGRGWGWGGGWGELIDMQPHMSRRGEYLVHVQDKKGKYLGHVQEGGISCTCPEGGNVLCLSRGMH